MALPVLANNNLYFDKSPAELKSYFDKINYDLTQFSNIRSLQRQAQETKKLLIIQGLKRQLNAKLGHNDTNSVSNPKECRAMSYFVYYFCLFGGFIQIGSESYLFGSTLFALIPGLVNPWLLVVSLVYVALDAILFYAFDAAQLRDALNIEYTSTGVSKLLETYADQLQEVKELNDMLIQPTVFSKLSCEEYKEYIACLKSFNDDLLLKQKKIGVYPESNWRKFCKSAIWLFGAFSSVAGDYFIANALLGLINSSLIGTPVGWVIIVLLTISGLGLYCAMEGRSVAHFVNPDFQVFKSLKNDLTLFNKKLNYEEEWKAVLTLKNSDSFSSSLDHVA